MLALSNDVASQTNINPAFILKSKKSPAVSDPFTL